MERKSRARAESGAFIAIVAVAVVFLNIFAVKVLHLRWDLTKRGLYSLSKGTQNTLRRLHDQLTITVYWTKDQPPPANDDERLLREQLDEYVASSNGNVTVRFVHPDNDERRRAAEGANCTKRVLQAVNQEQQQAQLQEVYRCITFAYLRNNERIDFVNPGIEGMEYQITSIIKKLVDPQRTIGFLTGHDEATPEAQTGLPYLSRLIEEAHLGYATRTVDLRGGEEDVPSDIKGLVIMNPTRAIPERELQKINAYLMRGGSVAIFAGGANVTGSNRPTAARAEHGLNALLTGYGVTINPNIVLDARSTDVVIRTDMGMGRLRLFSFPTLTDEGLDQSHPAVFRLPQIVTPYVSTLSIDRARATQNGTRLTVIGRTSPYTSIQREGSWSLDPIELWQNRRTLFDGSTHPQHAVMVALEGQLRSAFENQTQQPPPASGDAGVSTAPLAVPSHASRERPARLLVVGSGRLATIEDVRMFAFQGVPPNVEMLFDVFDWLSQDPDLLAVRAKNVSEPELRADISPLKKQLFQWGSIVGLPVIVGVIGVVLSQLRARRRTSLKL